MSPNSISPGPGASGKRTLLLLNRKCRSGTAGAAEAMDLLSAHGLPIEAHVLQAGDDLHALLRERAGHIDRVVIGGGDGTLHRALEPLVAARLPLGVLPMGTANDLAHSLGLPMPLEDACEVIARGHTRAIDLGWVNGKLFLNAANIGLGVEVTHRLSGAAKRRWGVLGYGLAALDAVRATRPFTARIQCDERAHRLRSIQIAVGNGRYHGGGLTLAEDASISDDRLDLYSVRPMALWRLLALIPALRRGAQQQWDGVDQLAGREMLIRTTWPMRVVADGEPVAWTPARFRVMPGALTVFVPADGERPDSGP